MNKRMLHITLAVLICACMASAAVYKIDSLRSIRNRRNSNPSEIRTLDDQLSTPIPPLRVWTNYTLELEGGNARASFRPILNPYDYRGDNVQTMPSQYPINYPDWSTYPIKRPFYMNDQSQTNMPQNPLDIMSQQDRNLQYPSIGDTHIQEMPTNIFTDPLVSQYRDNPSSFHLNDMVLHIGTPPNYSQSLYEYDQLSDEMLTYLQDTNERIQLQFVLVMSVIDGMINAMVKSPWRYYEQVYNSLVDALISFPKENSSLVKAQINCLLNEAKTGLSKVRTLMIHACTDSQMLCDHAIDTYVKSGDHDLNKSAQLLLALGKVARLYREKFAQELSPIHTFDKYPANMVMLLGSGAKYLEPLIKAGTEALRLFPPAYYNCYVIYQN